MRTWGISKKAYYSLKFGASVVVVSGALFAAVYAVGGWFFDLQTRSDAIKQHVVLEKKFSAKIIKVRDGTAKSIKGLNDDIKTSLKEYHLEVKQDLRGVQLRIDAMYREVRRNNGS